MATATAGTPDAGATAPARPRRRRSLGPGRSGALLTLLAWIVGLLFVAPILWMVLTSLHGESDAAANPPAFAAALTLDGYRSFFAAGPWPPLINSLSASVVSTLLVLALATPAAYALAIRPVPRWRDVMFFALSAKFLPPIAALLPVYLIARNLDMLDNLVTLVVLYTAMNLPIAIWMMRSFLAEVPREILEAAEIDGARLATILWRIVLPVATPGLVATGLICFIFSWNELMFARVLTSTTANTAPVFLTGFITSQGLFLAQLSAAAFAISIPVLAAGFAAQDRLVQGLSLGAIK